jgi:hypothetical protein
MLDGVARAIDIGLVSEVLIDVVVRVVARVDCELANTLEGVARAIEVGLDGEVLTAVDDVVVTVGAGVT